MFKIHLTLIMFCNRHLVRDTSGLWHLWGDTVESLPVGVKNLIDLIGVDEQNFSEENLICTSVIREEIVIVGKLLQKGNRKVHRKVKDKLKKTGATMFRRWTIDVEAKMKMKKITKSENEKEYKGTKWPKITEELLIPYEFLNSRQEDTFRSWSHTDKHKVQFKIRPKPSGRGRKVTSSIFHSGHTTRILGQLTRVVPKQRILWKIFITKPKILLVLGLFLVLFVYMDELSQSSM